MDRKRDIVGGVDLKGGAEDRKGYPHHTERKERVGGMVKDSERHRWKRETLSSVATDKSSQPCCNNHALFLALFFSSILSP